jgi:hypothetical protein
MRRRTTLKHNKTIFALRRGLIRMTKRLTIPCVHIDQIRTAVRVLRELADEMERTLKQNEPSNVDKCMMAQSHIMTAHHRLLRQWNDPRGHYTGGEKLEWSEDGLTQTKGHDELRSRLEKEEDGRTLHEEERFTG